MAANGTTGVAATGDEVGRLYADYGSKLQRFCLGRLRSREEAEDAVQQTFLRVYTALRQGTVPEYEAAWLYKIAHNVCLSRIESSARRARLEAPHDFSALEDELAAPGNRNDELVGLEQALAEMPANLRQAILLREWQGLSYAEISEALGVSVSAVESLIFRARRHLATALVEPGRKLAGMLNLPWLVGGIRALLGGLRNGAAGAGAGTKLAAGVALLAVGGGGAGLGLAVGASSTPPPAVTGQPAAAGAGGAAATLAGIPRSELAAATTAETGGKTTAQGKRPGGATGGAIPVAGTTTTGRTPGPTTVPATPETPTGTTPIRPEPPLTAPPRTSPQPPASTTPGVTTPKLPLPTVPLPTVEVPTVQVPTLPVTVPSTPAVTVPPVATLPVTVPTVTVPPVTLPRP